MADRRRADRRCRAEFSAAPADSRGRPPWLIVWEGRLTGFDKPYLVRIVWPRLSPWDTLELQIDAPKVFVIDPPLADRGPAFEARVPHLYRYRESPYLCLFDPVTDEWDGTTMSVADTIIPWTARWLASYEIWRVTGTGRIRAGTLTGGPCDVDQAR